LCALDNALQNVDPEIKGEYELVISAANFVPRSPISKAAYQLMTTLNSENGDLKAKIFAAQGLLKLGRYQEEAIAFLTLAITDESNIPAIKDIKDRSELLANVMEALGELSSCGCGSKSSNPNEEDQQMFYTCSDGKEAPCNIKRNGIWYARCANGEQPC
jgi:hypothetical protein